MNDTQEKLARALYETIRPVSDRPQRPDGINGQTWGDHACALTKALNAQGLAIVPLEPTEAMVIAGCHHENMGDMAGRYKAMILNQDPKPR